VSLLLLAGNSLTGSLPTEIGRLTSVESINFGTWSSDFKPEALLGKNIKNRLTKSSRHYHILYLPGYTYLTGLIPSELGLMTSLTSLSFGKNVVTLFYWLHLVNRQWILLSQSLISPHLSSCMIEYTNLEGPLISEIGLLTNLLALTIGRYLLDIEIF
jgi:Leucine-rich repeat (LRR) protein